jgi:hypothetical protein
MKMTLTREWPPNSVRQFSVVLIPLPPLPLPLAFLTPLPLNPSLPACEVFVFLK